MMCDDTFNRFDKHRLVTDTRTHEHRPEAYNVLARCFELYYVLTNAFYFVGRS